MESIRKKLPRRQSTLSDADLDFIVANTSNSDKDMLRKQGDGSFISFNGLKIPICSKKTDTYFTLISPFEAS